MFLTTIKIKIYFEIVKEILNEKHKNKYNKQYFIFSLN
jgi:hypothetical protein